jgi:hypothetical protein
MKKKLFNNKGSTMVMLVIAVAVISLLGTSILAVTLMNYRIKLANTEMKTAFYLSESGLDRAYENAYKLIVTAVTDANDAANEFVDSFDDDKMLDLIEARDFNYLEPKTFSEDTVYKYDESAIQEAAKDIFEKEYVDVILAKGSYIGDDDIADVLRNASDDDLIVEVTNEPLSFSGKEMTVGIESEYTSDKGTKRITAVNLIVEIPKYNESYAIETKIVDVNPFWLKALAARRLDIENSSTFRGDVFVEENLNVNSSGINPKFNNVLAVRGYTGASDVPDEDKGIRLNDSSTANVSNVFAKNILLTAPGARFRADSSGSKIYVRDDLEINGSNQTVYINGSYFGFSDGSEGTTPDTSSGININETSGLSLTITGGLYLHGTSYVDVYNASGKKYQTGESLSIKGNYRAYLQPLLNYSLSGGKDLRDVGFTDYGHLRLADHFNDGNPLVYAHKADYINFYQSEYGGLTIPAGINISGTIRTLGSAIDSGVLTPASYNPFNAAHREVFEEAEKEYKKQTEGLGYDTDINGNSIGVLKFSEEIKYTTLIDVDDPLNYIHLIDDGSPITLDAREYKGLIITNGNITIGPNVERFEGTIICGGTVTIQGSQLKEFYYNKNVVSKIIADKNLHKSVFDGSTIVDRLNVTTFKTDEGEGGNIDFTNLLSFRNWKIK